jgi:hypothetical protein
MGEVVSLNAGTPTTDLAALAMERAAAVLAIRAIDNAYASAVLERAAALEDACQHVAMTTLALPSLPPGVIEDARQIADKLPSFVARVMKLMNPVGGR